MGNANARAEVVPGREPVADEQLPLLSPADGGPLQPSPPSRGSCAECSPSIGQLELDFGAGNPTKSYRTRHPLRVTAEIAEWQGHPPEQLRAMKDHLARFAEQGIEAIEE